jgi:crotonobetainyl-CoA:carnitine CoA-transferase CaiB-like acyl-CoA transferase
VGNGLYERTGTRFSASPGGYDRAGPTLGQDNDWALRELLGLGPSEIDALRSAGAVE